ncbi:hypothetical protein ElyMa_003634100 [Elysia marginata]|uniref:Uncharacterized protein n=1 Tax=Elysia marginata TaxID=1093978 RepID=A0AAV4EW35_9GAST|nr:hypothetical protein ElyMa_003634100 [Elysia marginata]
MRKSMYLENPNRTTDTASVDLNRQTPLASTSTDRHRLRRPQQIDIACVYLKPLRPNVTPLQQRHRDSQTPDLRMTSEPTRAAAIIV